MVLQVMIVAGVAKVKARLSKYLAQVRAGNDVLITEHGRPIGDVSIGDLALERDPASALADISATPPST